VLAFLVYCNTLRFHEYVLDDQIYTTKNSYVQKGISAFKDLVTKNSLGGYTEVEMPPDYRPLAIIDFAMEKTFFGNSPRANHFFNVLFYALLCVVVFGFCKRIFSGYPVYLAAIVTALFVLHPIHTEVVANIKSRDE